MHQYNSKTNYRTNQSVLIEEGGNARLIETSKISHDSKIKQNTSIN